MTGQAGSYEAEECEAEAERLLDLIDEDVDGFNDRSALAARAQVYATLALSKRTAEQSALLAKCLS